MMGLFHLAVVALVIPNILCYEYDAVYNTLDVDKIVADDALFSSYVDCFLDKIPCTAEHSSDFKKLLPEVIKESCAKCSAIQKDKVRTFVKALYKKKPSEAIKFQEKYDPQHEYEASFTAFITATE